MKRIDSETPISKSKDPSTNQKGTKIISDSADLKDDDVNDYSETSYDLEEDDGSEFDINLC